MRTLKNLILLIALVCTTTAWAEDYNVGTDADLRAAIQNDGANITVTANINLSNSTLEITGNRTVTINLNNHTLDRKLTKRGEGGGQVFTVRNGSTLNLSRGIVRGGWGGDGGGLLIQSGATANLTNVTIDSNTADDRGGGISNHGTLTMKGCTVIFNTNNKKVAPSGGGGIYNDGTLNMEGATTIMQNETAGSPDNLYLPTGKIITVIGPLTSSNIYINLESIPATFTSGYSTWNSGIAPADYFTSDVPDATAVTLDDAGTEAQLISSHPQNDVNYIECSWDSENKQVVKTTKTLTTEIAYGATPTNRYQYKVLPSNPAQVITYLGTQGSTIPEFYVVRDEVELYRVWIRGSNVHIILCDGATFKPKEGITVHIDHRLEIHTQSSGEEMGKLRIDDKENYGIGGFDWVHEGYEKIYAGGTIVIHDGDIYIKGGKGAAIGGRIMDYTAHIYGGNIYAEGAMQAAGIGADSGVNDIGTINIYGGTIVAIGGDVPGLNDDGGAGIGGAFETYQGTIHIYGGDITATGRHEAAGIGTSQDVHKPDNNEMKVIIEGGIVRAYGDNYAAGIGGGDGIHGCDVTITGGEVYAYGGMDAAGIGGGEGADGGKVTISGGYVEAYGSDDGAGIGGGQDGDGADVKITGGTVLAQGGGNKGTRAIGPGAGCDDYGSLTIGDKMMVGSETLADASNRKNTCWYNRRALIEPCTHPGKTYTVSGNLATDTHTAHCKYCTTEFTPEQHTFVGNCCVVCYVTSTLYTASIYLPVIGGSTYDTAVEYKMVDGTNFSLPAPPDRETPANLEFAGWLVGVPPVMTDIETDGTETLLPVGAEYTITSDVNFTARYKKIDMLLVDNEQNGEILSKNNGRQVNSITLSGRTLYRDGTWNTLCLPFSLSNFFGTPLLGATVKTLESTSFDSATGTLTLNFTKNSLNSIEAGIPYIVKWPAEAQLENITDPVFNTVTISTALNPVVTATDGASEGTEVTFAGAFSPLIIGLENRAVLYLGANNTLYYPRAAMTIKSCRAHFRMKGLHVDDIASARIFFDDEETTGIESVSDESGMKDHEWYDLSGRKYSQKPTQKGVYIHKGKKIVK